MRKNAKNAFYYNKNRKNYDIQIGDYVYCRLKSKLNREKLEVIYIGPIRIIDRTSERIFRIHYGGRFRDIHVKNIRVAAANRCWKSKEILESNSEVKFEVKLEVNSGPKSTDE